MQGGRRPTKAQQAWQDWQRSQGCCNCGAPNPAIHHAVGSTAKHNKVHIGQWWTLPLCYECHQGDGGIHKSCERLTLQLSRKEIEKDLFFISVNSYGLEFDDYPMPMGVIDAIMDYHK